MAALSKILLVEDNPQIIEMYKIVLTKNGYPLVIALTVDDALVQAKSFNPDVILLDIMLPGNRTGLDALMLFRTNEEYGCKDKRILMLTNLGLTEDIQKVCEEYADGYIVKAEIVPSDLPKLIENVISTD